VIEVAQVLDQRQPRLSGCVQAGQVVVGHLERSGGPRLDFDLVVERVHGCHPVDLGPDEVLDGHREGQVLNFHSSTQP
jgi:hypothetical protein